MNFGQGINYNSTIAFYNAEENVYRIDFDDGEIYHSVSPIYIRKPKKQSRLSSPQLLQLVSFNVGERIEAKCFDWSKFYSGTITKINTDKTYRVTFDDGEKVDAVRLEEMRKIGVENNVDAIQDDEDDFEEEPTVVVTHSNQLGLKKVV